jgi:surfeit locus 1 family protein
VLPPRGCVVVRDAPQRRRTVGSLVTTLPQERPRGGLVRALLWPGFFSLLGVALLISLGVWQLHRLAWKEALIAQVTSRVGAPPAPLPSEADWPRLLPSEYEYRHVRVAGTFDTRRQVFVYRALETPRGQYGGPGYLVLTPLRLAEGGTILVNRGFVPDERKQAVAAQSLSPDATVDVTGLMRSPEPRTWFTPADDPAKGEWFTRDPAAIGAAMKLDRLAPFTIDADANADPAALPEGGETVISFPNNHLAYAFTWFGMAAALIGVFTAFALKKRAELADADAARAR